MRLTSLVYLDILRHMIKVIQLLPHYQNSKTNLAKALGVSKQLISAWGDGPIYELHEWRVRYRYLPDVYFDPRGLENYADIKAYRKFYSARNKK